MENIVYLQTEAVLGKWNFKMLTPVGKKRKV